MIVLNDTDEESRCLLQDDEGSREFNDNGGDGGGESDGGVDADGENDRDGGEG